MSTLFDYQRGEEAKQSGMNAAADAKPDLLALARSFGREIAMSRESRECNADDIQALLAERGYGIRSLGNAAGALFRGKEWEFTGKWIESARVHSHRNRLRIWRYIGNQ